MRKARADKRLVDALAGGRRPEAWRRDACPSAPNHPRPKPSAPLARLRFAQLSLVGALARLVVGQRLSRIHVAQRRMGRDEALGGLDPEVLGQNRAERLDLHLPKAGQRSDVRPQLVGVRGVGPYAGGVAAVGVAN